MVVALGPGKFYGSSLPRPRFYENPNGERVDPPVPVLAPLMSWAEEAHWSMGGLSFKRLRLQGRIEGNVKKLRAEKEKIQKKKSTRKGNAGSSPAPPTSKMGLPNESDDGENEEIGAIGRVEKRGPARKLDDDFDRVLEESGRAVVEKAKTKGRRLRKIGDKKTNTLVARASPRLSKHGLS